jgi:hypothetical protein
MAAGRRDLDPIIITQPPGAGHAMAPSAEPGADWSPRFLGELATVSQSPARSESR